MYLHLADNGDWLMSLLEGEGAPKYRYTGVQFQVLEKEDAQKNTRPLYRCVDKSGIHYQSTINNCEFEGSTFEGLLGYIYADDPGDGAHEVWRCSSPSLHTMVATAELGDCTLGGYTVQAVLGWAYPATFVRP
jgi:hypothetical protein